VTTALGFTPYNATNPSGYQTISGSVNTANSATTAGTATSATTAGTVTTAAQGNITSVGTLTSLSVSGTVTGGNLSTTGNVTTTNRLVATGIEFTNYAWTSVTTTGGTTNLPGGVNNMKRVFVFTGTSNQIVSTPLTTFNTVVPEFYIINNSTGTLFIQDVVGFELTNVPPGATLTLTAILTSTTGVSSWRASFGASNFALACGGQTWQVVSRSLAVTYTNSTNRPIQVSIYFLGSSGSEFRVNGLTIASNSSQTGWMTVSEVIPPNATYQLVDINGGLGSLNWYELR
jgi:hypothetical protein